MAFLSVNGQKGKGLGEEFFESLRTRTAGLNFAAVFHI
jgi:hypothetical protein